MTFPFLKVEAVDKSLSTAKNALKSYYPGASMFYYGKSSRRWFSGLFNEEFRIFSDASS